MPQHLIERSGRHDLAPMTARARTEIHDVIRRANRLFIVLYDKHRVAQIAQLLQRRQQARIVALVQPDRGLVEDVEHADQPAADLRREPDPLRFPARQRRCRAIESEVVEPHIHEKAQPVGDFFEDRLGDFGVETGAAIAAQRNAREELERLAHGQRHDVADALAGHEDGQALRLEAPAPASRTGLLHHVLLELLADCVRRRLAIALFDVIEHAFPARLVRAVPAFAVVLIRDRLAGCALEQNLLHGRRQVAPRCIEIELVSARQRREDHLPQIAARLTPGQHHPLKN